MKLIIGKNSLLVNKIKKKLYGFEFISHTEAKTHDFKKYNYIFLFSWPKKIDKDYWNILNLIPKNKLVFISSIAVFSCFLRPQFYQYPNQKLIIEKAILKNGGSILRLGIFHNSWQSFSNEVIPFTSYISLIEALNLWRNRKNKIINLFELIENKNQYLSYLNLFYWLHSKIKNKYIRILIDFLLKKLGSKNYGYTKDCLVFFQKEIQIGYGVLGEYLLNKNKHKNLLTIVSSKKDILLNDNGFKNTILGYNFNGLKKFWHGVSIKSNIDSTFKKKSQIIISRKKIPKNCIIDHVVKIDNEYDKFQIYGESGNYFAKKVYFAAGPIENVRLVSSLINYQGKANFSDHDLILLGQCDTSELIIKKYLIRKLFFVINNKLLTDKFDFFLDFRPLSKNTLRKNTNDFYLDATQNIIFKLIKGFSLTRLNEAFFNKFGFAFYTKKTLCFAQVVNNNCINFDLLNKKITRKNISKEVIKNIIKLSSATLKTFKPLNSPLSIDGQHIIGAEKLLDNPSLKELISNNQIFIAGSPTKRKLDFRHHSSLLIEDISK